MALTKTRNRRRAEGEGASEKARSTFSVSWRPWARALVGGLVLAGLWKTQAWARQAPLFALKSVRVTGAERASNSEILKLSGFVLGENLFELQVKASEKSIAAHPWVKKATVRRQFPSTVVVDVVEHQAVAWIALGDLYLLDSEGEPFKKATPSESLDLPVLTGIDRDAYLADSQKESERIQQVLAVMETYNHLPESKRAPMSEVRLTRDGIELFVGHGEEIHLGAHDAVERLGQLGLVREELMRQGLSARVIHLDNRVRPGWVTVQLSAPHAERQEH